MNHFYNTTAETGQTLFRFRSQAKAQAERVIEFFRNRPGELIGPSEAWRATGLEAENVPLTNVRRAITDATKAGILVRTKNKTIGAYGHPETQWVCPRQGQAVSGGDLLL
jgi:hypothetical protein